MTLLLYNGAKSNTCPGIRSRGYPIGPFKAFLSKKRIGCFLGILGLGFILWGFPLHNSFSKPVSAGNLHTQRAMNSFLLTLQTDLLSQLTLHLAEKNPKEALSFLAQIHRELKVDLFLSLVQKMCDHPAFLKRFLDASVLSLDLPKFTKIVRELTLEPEAIRAISLQSIANQTDESLIKMGRATTRYPESLKYFASIMDETALVEFAKTSLENRAAMAFLIGEIQGDIEKIREISEKINLRKITLRILSQIDKDYFKNLLAPDNADQELLFHSLSLTDGIIDIQGREQIEIKGVNRQAVKMLDPFFVLSFLWNIYFGDQTSQIAINYRKTLSLADKEDGTKDKIVNLRILAQKNPEIFRDLADDFALLLQVARFQKKFTDPDLLIDPVLDFIQKYQPHEVADTLSPLFIRSLEIEPKLAKITILELPPVVLGDTLNQLLIYLGKTPEGQKIHRQLVQNLWETLDAEGLKKFLIKVLDENPQALFDIIIPVTLELSGPGLRQITLVFMEFPQLFYRFNAVSLPEIGEKGIQKVTRAVTQNPDEYFELALEVIDGFQESKLNKFFVRLVNNNTAQKSMDRLLESMEKEFLQKISAKILANPAAQQTMEQGFPPLLVQRVHFRYSETLNP